MSKVKFNSGKDANDMLVRQLVSNFLLVGTIRQPKKRQRLPNDSSNGW